MRSLSSIWGMAALFAILAGAQLRAQSGNPVTGTIGPAASPPSVMRSSDGTYSIPLPASSLQAIVLIGKVLIEGGAAPDTPVKIERVCGASPRAEGFTDARGNFSIVLGQEQSGTPDASETPSRGSSTQLAGCELRALLAGYRSGTVSLSGVHYGDNPNVGTIFLHRLANVNGFTTSATSGLAPKDARKAYKKALSAMKKNKPDDAQKLLQHAVAIYPKYAVGWFELGRLYERRGALDQARDAYAQSIAADSKYVNPYQGQYLIAYREGKWQEAADLSDRVLRMNPFDFPEAYYFNAVANLRLDRLDTAEKSAREAVKLDTAHQDARSYYALGFILARERNYSEAAENLKTYLAMAPPGTVSDEVRKQLGGIARNAQAQAQPRQVNPH
jgi:tetratricopeptide (TPR) repeat protein